MHRLEDLVVDASEIDRELTAEILDGFITIEKGKGVVRFSPEWRRKDNTVRILLYLIGVKASVALFPGEGRTELRTPSQIATDTQIAGGAVRPIMRDLLKKGLVIQEKQGGYLVPAYAISMVKAVVEDADTQNKKGVVKDDAKRG